MKNLIHFAEPTTRYLEDLKWIQLPSDSFACTVLKLDSITWVGGFKINVRKVQIPGYWKDGVWTELPCQDLAHHSSVLTMSVSGGDVYAGGFSSNSNGVQIPGYWKNEKWHPLLPLDEARNAAVSALVVSREDIFAAGYCLNKDQTLVSGYWKNGSWYGLSLQP